MPTGTDITTTARLARALAAGQLDEADEHEILNERGYATDEGVSKHVQQSRAICWLDVAARKIMRDYAEYYVGMLRENGGKNTDCLAR